MNPINPIDPKPDKSINPKPYKPLNPINPINPQPRVLKFRVFGLGFLGSGLRGFRSFGFRVP